MSARFSPYFKGEWHPPSSASVAYIRPNGSITVFLPNGTALDLSGSDLLRFDPGPEPNPPTGSSQDPTVDVGGDSSPDQKATEEAHELIASGG